MTATTTLPACDFDWCNANHADGELSHFSQAATVPDMYGNLVNVELFFNPDTGRAGIAVGEHQIYLLDAMDAVAAMRKQIEVGAAIPGALAAELAASR